MTFVKSTIKDPKTLCGELKKQFIADKAMEWENSAKDIIREGAVDTGQLINSIFTEIHDNGFIGVSSAEHAMYLEFRKCITLRTSIFKVGQTDTRRLDEASFGHVRGRNPRTGRAYGINAGACLHAPKFGEALSNTKAYIV